MLPQLIKLLHEVECFQDKELAVTMKELLTITFFEAQKTPIPPLNKTNINKTKITQTHTDYTQQYFRHTGGL